MATVCKEINERVEEKVSKPIEEWVRDTKKYCKKKFKWYNPLSWVCWLVTTLIRVVRWVVSVVVRFVVRWVCWVVTTLWEYAKDVFRGIVNIIAGIFTADWRRILDGLIGILTGFVLTGIQVVRLVLWGELVAFVIDEINDARIRDHVRRELARRYSGRTYEEIKRAINLDYGPFGLRMTGTVYRTVLDSQTRSPTDPTTPNLVVLHERGEINLHELCGFKPYGYLQRRRYTTLKKEDVIGGGGGGRLDNPISEEELNTYLGSRGARGPAFQILPMSEDELDTKLDAARDKGRQLGLKLTFNPTTVEVTRTRDIILDPGAQDDFLKRVIGRTDKEAGPGADDVARRELCNPAIVGIFRYRELSKHGQASNLRGSACGLPSSLTSGVTFTDNLPDRVWKYVLIHELGHYFGLCHTDGLDRIMYTAAEEENKSWFTLRILWTAYIAGEPEFSYSEMEEAWTWMVANLAPQCLGASTAPEPAPSPVPPATEPKATPQPPPPVPTPQPPKDDFRAPK
ncbi:hypothetical protein [Streptomyces sp. NPDC056628]|uniref:hypothetical protein n=1 Tax=Streptomyces sp. NPDC056628 TaxID=3345882 RepID=UPI0036BE6002